MGMKLRDGGSRNRQARFATAESRLRTLIRRQTIVFRSSYCAEHHCVGRETRVERSSRQRRAELFDRNATDGVLFKIKSISVNRRNCLQYRDCFSSYFWSNPIAGKCCNLNSHKPRNCLGDSLECGNFYVRTKAPPRRRTPESLNSDYAAAPTALSESNEIKSWS